MDRDNRWDRVQKGYEAIVNATPKSEQSVADYIENAYALGETDEFITPRHFMDTRDLKRGMRSLPSIFEVTGCVNSPLRSEIKILVDLIEHLFRPIWRR
jgi:hypothetical protein